MQLLLGPLVEQQRQDIPRWSKMQQVIPSDIKCIQTESNGSQIFHNDPNGIRTYQNISKQNGTNIDDDWWVWSPWPADGAATFKKKWSLKISKTSLNDIKNTQLMKQQKRWVQVDSEFALDSYFENIMVKSDWMSDNECIKSHKNANNCWQNSRSTKQQTIANYFVTFRQCFR
jgi:hypothetical protein